MKRADMWALIIFVIVFWLLFASGTRENFPTTPGGGGGGGGF